MPKFPLARDQSVAQHWLVGPSPEVLDVMLGVCNQNLFDELGSARQKHPARTNAYARKRAIVSSRFEQEVEQAGAELADVAPNHRSLRPGRQSRASW